MGIVANDNAQPERSHVMWIQCMGILPSGYSTQPWKIPYKWRFIAGKIIYKWAIYTMAMLNNQRVYN